jgi:hypothetical protein
MLVMRLSSFFCYRSNHSLDRMSMRSFTGQHDARSGLVVGAALIGLITCALFSAPGATLRLCWLGPSSNETSEPSESRSEYEDVGQVPVSVGSWRRAVRSRGAATCNDRPRHAESQFRDAHHRAAGVNLPRLPSPDSWLSPLRC